MTIEKNVATLKEHLNTLNVDKGVEFYQEIESIQSAIDIMRKYQKIQEIINNAKDSDGAVKYNWLYEQIGEVIEDGNDN